MYPNHESNITALRRVEGQIRGIQKMIRERKYCVDILYQIHAAMKALARVEDKILEKHLAGCVTSAVKSRSASAKNKKFRELVDLVSQFRKV